MPEFNVSRRKVLAGLGTIGIASAGAGLGTTAFFSDEESLDGSLEAGKIDLKLDYRSTYVPWDRQTAFDSIGTIPGTDMNDDGTDDRYVLDETPNVTYSEDEAADRDDVEAGDLLTEDDWGVLTNSIGCEDEDAEYDLVDGDAGVVVDLVDVKPKDEGEFTVSMHVCDNRAYLWMQTEKTDDSDVSLVEPEIGSGDPDGLVEGEPDFSLIDSDGGDGELDDYMYVEAWYDTNCNNVRDAEDGVCAVFVADRSGSMTQDRQDLLEDGLRDFADVFNPDSNTDDLGENALGLVSYGDRPLTAEVRTNLTNSESAFDAAVDDLMADDFTGGTPAYYGIDAARIVYENDMESEEPLCADKPKYVVLFTDGRFNDEPGTNNDGDGQDQPPGGQAIRSGDGPTELDRARDAVEDAIADLRAAVPDVTVITVGVGEALEAQDDQDFLEQIADENDEGEDLFFSAGVDAIDGVLNEVARFLIPDILLYRGSLAGLLAAGAGGIALNPQQTENFQVDTTGEDAVCVDPGVTCIAVKWYLPCFDEQDDGRGFDQLHSSLPGFETLADELSDKGLPTEEFDAINVVQTDSVGFTLRFAAIQCRHNMDNPSPYALRS